MRQLLDSFSRDKTDAEDELWERFIPTSDMGWIDVEYAVQRWINVFFFSGDESEYYIPEDNIAKYSTKECIHCQEKAFDLLCRKCVDLYNTKHVEDYCVSCEEADGSPMYCSNCSPAWWAIQHRSQIESLVFERFDENQRCADAETGADREYDYAGATELAREKAYEYLDSIAEIEPQKEKEVVDGLRTPCDCGKNYEDGCECLPF